MPSVAGADQECDEIMDRVVGGSSAASDTDWQVAGIAHANAQHMMVRGLIERNQAATRYAHDAARAVAREKGRQLRREQNSKKSVRPPGRKKCHGRCRKWLSS
jgi:hypothetical protein